MQLILDKIFFYYKKNTIKKIKIIFFFLKIIFLLQKKRNYSNILASSVYDKYIQVVDVYSSLFFEKNTQILPFKTPTLLCVTCPPQLCFGVIIEDFTLTRSPTLMPTETFFVNKYEN